MSFLNIKDLEENFKPVVASNQKMTQDVINGLIRIREEMKDVNGNIDI